jgi:hypothetical protein
MKELQSQKARIVAQMVPTETPNAPVSPLEDTENIPVTEVAQSERRGRVRTREVLSVIGETAFRISQSEQSRG